MALTAASLRAIDCGEGRTNLRALEVRQHTPQKPPAHGLRPRYPSL